MKAKRTWIVIADAGRATIFLNEGPSTGMHAVEGATFENPNVHLHARDFSSDRPGRSVESVGGARHAEEPRTDPHRQDKLHFAKSVAIYLEQAAQDGRFDRLVLVAPSTMLGDLRGTLGRHAASRVTAELHKDLMKTPTKELAAHLGPVVRV